MAKSKKTAYVYLFATDQGWWKIGQTINPERRLRDLSTLPFNIWIEHIIEYHSAGALERRIHDRFKDKRISGEWFRLDTKDVKWFKSLAPNGGKYDPMKSKIGLLNASPPTRFFRLQETENKGDADRLLTGSIQGG